MGELEVVGRVCVSRLSPTSSPTFLAGKGAAGPGQGLGTVEKPVEIVPLEWQSRGAIHCTSV